ncbi:MAG: alpha-ketoglutarate-dependent dioxygenase AlkB [Cyanobacteria bacterium]|nr:alpha-ketoglutarate-dependent dioxygenase AlkB [Cyanobacteria bacterium bin.51]
MSAACQLPPPATVPGTETLKLRHWPGWWGEATATLKGLQAEVPWQQDSIHIFGQRRLLPRLTCWMADPGFDYAYSGEQQIPQPWIPRVLDLRRALAAIAGCAFNSVLLNLYRDGNDRMGWHADDEAELDPSAPIASLSLGATRSFRFKPKGRGPQSGERHCLELGHGDLLLMDPPTQEHWLHELPSRRRVSQPRLNLTFRRLRPR